MRISKTFRWEMGHRLVDHTGGCRNLHGHSYRMRIDVEGEPVRDGMVIDFDDISQAIRPLLAELDHAFLCDERDEDLITFLKERAMKHVVTPFPSTVENICIYLSKKLEPTLRTRDNIDSFTVRIHETESSSAELTTHLRTP